MSPIDPERYALFLGVMTAVAATPGPAILFSLATGVRAGPAAALLGVAGINAASLVWITLAALGLGAAAAAYPEAFRVIALLGAAYVAWLGLKSLIEAAKGAPTLAESKPASPGHALRDGFVVQISNPKAIIFFAAMLPMFVDPARPAGPQFAILGTTAIVLDVAFMSAVGLAGGAFARVLAAPAARRAIEALTGVLLIAVAVLLALRH